MQTNLLNPQFRSCYKCNYEANTPYPQCPRCGKTLYTRAKIRALGGVLVFLGGFIAVVMALVAAFTFGVITQADVRQVKEQENELLFAAGIVGLTFVAGLSFALAGLWQIIFGRRNRAIIWISLGLVAVLLIAGRVFVGITN